MIIDCISDLHGHYPKLEGGDLLIVAGDLTARDSPDEHIKFGIWLGNQNYKKKIWIAGNHDNFLVGTSFIKIKDVGMDYLCDSGTEFHYHDERFPEEDEGFLPSGKRTLKIWGSPWTKTFEGMNPKCKAFTVDTEEELAVKFSLIPDDVDILVTHSPPYGLLDCVENYMYGKKENVGSLSLGNICKKLKHKLHVFGHIHEEYGYEELQRISDESDLKIVNASLVNEHYQPVNKPVRVIL